MREPLTSIIIPCYNSAPFISDAIRSCLDQTYSKREIIVIDDGSTDNSVDVLKTFGSKIYWETGPNRGACSARNRGLQIAQGERIQFLDADDFLHPDKISRQIEALQINPHATPTCDGEITSEGKTIRRIKAPPSCTDSVAPLLKSILQTPSPLHSRDSLVLVNGFREELPCSQERDLHLRLACNGWALQRIPEVLYTVRKLPNSISSSHHKVILQHMPLAARVRDILQEQGKWTDEYARAVSGFLAHDARILARLGYYEQSAAYFRAASEYHSRGGWEHAYGRFNLLTRFSSYLIGPVNLERLLGWLKARANRRPDNRQAPLIDQPQTEVNQGD